MEMLPRRGTRTRADTFRVQRVGLDGDSMMPPFNAAVWEKEGGTRTGKCKIAEFGWDVS